MNTSLVMYCCCEYVFGGSTGVNSLIFLLFVLLLLFFYKGAYFLLSRFGSWCVRREVVQGGWCYVLQLGLHRVHSAFFSELVNGQTPLLMPLFTLYQEMDLGNFLVGCWDIQERYYSFRNYFILV